MIHQKEDGILDKQYARRPRESSHSGIIILNGIQLNQNQRDKHSNQP